MIAAVLGLDEITAVSAVPWSPQLPEAWQRVADQQAADAAAEPVAASEPPAAPERRVRRIV